MLCTDDLLMSTVEEDCCKHLSGRHVSAVTNLGCHVWQGFRLIRHTALSIHFLLFLLLPNVLWFDFSAVIPIYEVKRHELILFLFFRPVFWCQFRSQARAAGGWLCHIMWTKLWGKVMDPISWVILQGVLWPSYVHINAHAVHLGNLLQNIV